MKKFLYLFFVLSLGLFAGCEEISPEINPQMGPNTDPDDPSPVEDQPRQVLIEEFTGVRCVNCPDGSEAIETLLNIHGEQLVAVSIHSSGSFSVPNDENAYDFRTTEGDNILSFLGEPIGYPTAVVNRKKFPDEFDLQLGKVSLEPVARTACGDPGGQQESWNDDRRDREQAARDEAQGLPNQTRLPEEQCGGGERQQEVEGADGRAVRWKALRGGHGALFQWSPQHGRSTGI